VRSAAVALSPGSDLVDATLVAAIGLVILAPIVRRIVRRRFDPFEPVVLFALAYGVMFVLRPAAMILRDERVYEGPRATLDVSAGFTEMLVLALLGATAFVVGYESGLGRRLARLHKPTGDEPPLPRLAGAAVLMGLLGALALVFALAWSGGMRAVGDVIRAGNTADLETGAASMYAWFLVLVTIPAALVLVRVALERRTMRLIGVASAFVALVLVQSVPFGSRITLLPFVGGLFVLVYLRRASRPAVATLVIVGAFAFLASIFLSDFRGRATRDEGIAETIARATSPSRLESALTRGPDSEMAPVLSAALTVIPEDLPHAYGRTIFGDLVVRPVPRAIWPGKPEIPRRELIATIWPVEFERGTVNVEFSALLYFYWDFGLLGVVVGLMVYGVLARYLYEYLLVRGPTIHGQVLFALALWFVVIGLRDSPVDTFVRGLFVLTPVWLVFALARSRLLARPDVAAIDSCGRGIAR
jgi:hypothetical protein